MNNIKVGRLTTTSTQLNENVRTAKQQQNHQHELSTIEVGRLNTVRLQTAQPGQKQQR